MRSGMTGVEISEFSIKERIEWEQYVNVNVVMSIKSLVCVCIKKERQKGRRKKCCIRTHTHAYNQYIVY